MVLRYDTRLIFFSAFRILSAGCASVPNKRIEGYAMNQQDAAKALSHEIANPICHKDGTITYYRRSAGVFEEHVNAISFFDYSLLWDTDKAKIAKHLGFATEIKGNLFLGKFNPEKKTVNKNETANVNCVDGFYRLFPDSKRQRSK